MKAEKYAENISKNGHLKSLKCRRWTSIITYLGLDASIAE